ncbi:MAG: filamentous hemagglutinin N-terminal domain-containing protein, partial [Phycisphaerales bacterium]|nr:filamentous hemagglutinin N-terminal domain-containing protein [Phycisphaerales bacterium]
MRDRTKQYDNVLMTAPIVGIVCSLAGAGPEGATVASGAAEFQTVGPLTSITVSDNAIINYSQFNIGLNETVQFIQPDASSRVLNRITGAGPSQIDGALLANGQVYLVNPSGVIFGPDSIVNVGTLFAG